MQINNLNRKTKIIKHGLKLNSKYFEFTYITNTNSLNSRIIITNSFVVGLLCDFKIICNKISFAKNHELRPFPFQFNLKIMKM